MPCAINLVGFFAGWHLLSAVVFLCALIAAADVGVMIYSIASFHKSQLLGPATFSYHKVTEVLWSLIPVIILAGSALPAVKASIANTDTCRAGYPQTINLP